MSVYLLRSTMVQRRRGERLGAVPFGQHAAVAVVGKDQPALARVAALAVAARHDGLSADVAVLVEFPDREAVDVDLVETLFHGGEIDLVGGIREVPRHGRNAAGHDLGRDDSHPALRVDEIRSDDHLVRFAMDHAVGMRAADALGAGGQVQRGVQLVELIVSAAKDVGRIRDVPELAGPGHDRPDAGFVGSAVGDGQLRIDAAEGRRITGRCVVDGGLPRVRKGCAPDTMHSARGT